MPTFPIWINIWKKKNPGITVGKDSGKIARYSGSLASQSQFCCFWLSWPKPFPEPKEPWVQVKSWALWKLEVRGDRWGPSSWAGLGWAGSEDWHLMSLGGGPEFTGYYKELDLQRLGDCWEEHWKLPSSHCMYVSVIVCVCPTRDLGEREHLGWVSPPCLVGWEGVRKICKKLPSWWLGKTLVSACCRSVRSQE